AQGKISKVDHDALMAAIAALKTVLAAIDEKNLVAQHMASTTHAVQQQAQAQISNLMAVARR
ncbi:MAG TPA: hypothetical protein VMI72_03090, partial [Roseiarcus sp.]|nr:hypothetical protein [Roseiarcus sp.]